MAKSNQLLQVAIELESVDICKEKYINRKPVDSYICTKIPAGYIKLFLYFKAGIVQLTPGVKKLLWRSKRFELESLELSGCRSHPD